MTLEEIRKLQMREKSRRFSNGQVLRSFAFKFDWWLEYREGVLVLQDNLFINSIKELKKLFKMSKFQIIKTLQK